MSGATQFSSTLAAVAVFDDLLRFLNRLAEANIPYALRHSRPDSVMVEVRVPGERWEVDFLADGDVDVEVFRSSGEVAPADDRLERLIEKLGEPSPAK